MDTSSFTAARLSLSGVFAHNRSRALMTDDTLQIRLATTEDMSEVMRLAITACEENAFLNASAAALAKEIWPALAGDHGLCPVIGRPGGEIEGLALLRIGAMWYAPDEVVLEEKCIFIYPQFRAAKGGRARRLVEYSKHAADVLGVPLIVGIMSNTKTEAKVRLYRRILGEPSGAFWLHGARAVPGHLVS
jgi:N-acetylglutamate synthase-like GNAT family acetyltransferase